MYYYYYYLDPPTLATYYLAKHTSAVYSQFHSLNSVVDKNLLRGITSTLSTQQHI